MKILLFGITNVGKSTIGKMLSQELNYDYDDLDDEIKKRYKRIDDFQEKYSIGYIRHKKRSDIVLELIDKYEDNVVIAVSPIWFEEFLEPILEQPNILAIELQDEPENILKRLVYADEEDNSYPLIINTDPERRYYLNEIRSDIKYYECVYDKIENKFDMKGQSPEDVTNRLTKYVHEIIS